MNSINQSASLHEFPAVRRIQGPQACSVKLPDAAILSCHELAYAIASALVGRPSSEDRKTRCSSESDPSSTLMWPIIARWLDASAHRLKDFQKWLDRKEISIFTPEKTKALFVAPGTYMTKAEAIRYCRESGFEVMELTAPAQDSLNSQDRSTQPQESDVLRNPDREINEGTITRHSTVTGPDTGTVDGTIKALIVSEFEASGLQKSDAQIVKQVILKFHTSIDTSRLSDFEKITGEGISFHIHRKGSRKVDHETIRGRVRTYRKRLSKTNATYR